jgi:DNA primase
MLNSLWGDNTIAVMQYIVNEIRDDSLEFQHPVYLKIYDMIADLVDRKMKLETNYFVMSDDVEVSSAAVEMMTSSYDDQMSTLWSKNDVKLETEEMKLKVIVPELVTSFKNKKLLDLLSETQEEIKSAQERSDHESIELLVQKFQILNELKKNISKELGDRIIL